MTEKCNSCEQMKKENRQLLRNRDEAVKTLVDTANDNFALRKEIDKLTNEITLLKHPEFQAAHPPINREVLTEQENWTRIKSFFNLLSGDNRNA